MSEKKTTSSKLTFKEKVAYGLGDISNGLAVSSVSVWYQYYLTDVVGLLVLLAGAAVMIGRLWDALTDPIMGWITDHTKSRWGKRLPYLLYGSVPYAVAYFMLWAVPEFSSQKQTFVYVTIALIVFNTCLTVIFVPYTSLTAAISNDYNERTSLTGYRMFCSQIAFLFGASLTPWLIDRVEQSEASHSFNQYFGTWAGTARQGHMIVAALFGLVMVISILITFFGTTERDVDEKPDDGTNNKTPLSYASSILEELMGNRPFLISVLILLLSNCAATLQAANLAYYIEYVLEMSEARPRILLTIFSAAILSVPIWVGLAKRFGKTECYRFAMLFYVYVLCGMPFVGPGVGNWIYLISAILGFAYAAALTLPWAIVPDVVEYDQLKTGLRREGLFYGGTTFAYKAATGIAFLISAFILWLAGYTANVAQSPMAGAAIRFLIGPAPAMLLIAAAILSIKYPLTAERHAKILKELAAKKKAAASS